jgi:thiol:disulfide interchange protein DsbD
MVVLKQALAFPMYAAAAWLVWVASVQSGDAGVLSAVAGLVLVGFAAWVQRFGRRFGRGLAGLALLVLLTLLPDLRSGNATPEIAERYTPQRLAELRAKGRPVFVNMTAAWCVTCLVNERVALRPQSVQAAFALGNVAYLKGDWTRQDPEITRFLSDKGRDGVPLYVFYPAHGGAPIVLPQVLMPSDLLQALSG